MTRLTSTAVIALTLFAVQAFAQTQQPYAGFQHRDIKALSAEQIVDLKAGRGMGLALAAELNGYPGPVHVLELADKLTLSDAQRGKVDTLYRAMKGEVIPIGDRYITQESALDRAFAQKTITPERLSDALAEIGVTQGALRTAHLKYHLATLEVLTPGQVHRYRQLRGYADGSGHDPGRHRH